MRFDALHNMVNQFVDLNDEERTVFENAFEFRKVPKNTTLIRHGQVSFELYFINKGLLRLYYDKDGELITAYIFRENHFASSYDSFLQGTPSIQVLESLEDSELLVLSKARLEDLYQRIPKINVFTRKVAEQRFINAQQILSSFLLDSPEVRYRKFASTNKDLLLRVPQHIIASYLGITPVSMSRIRKRLLEKDA